MKRIICYVTLFSVMAGPAGLIDTQASAAPANQAGTQSTAGLANPADTRGPAAAPGVVTLHKLSWRLAGQLAADAVSACESRGVSVTATVIDSAGLRQAIVKGDSVGPHSLELSYRKAFTAFAVADSLGVASTGEVVRSGKMTTGAPALDTDPNLIFLPGGVVIHSHGKTLLGGLGVSGSPSGLIDEACAAQSLEQHQAEIDQ